MAVQQSVKRRSRQSGISVDERRRVDEWVIQCEAGDGPEVALASTSLPAIGDADGGYSVVDIDANQIPEAVGAYTVSVTYSTNWNRGGGSSGDPADRLDPLSREVEIDVDFQNTTETIYYDKDGNPLDNSAYKPFEG